MSAAREPLEGLRRHKLMPKPVREALPAIRAQDGKGGEAVAHVKFFSAFSRYTFYVTEWNGEDLLYGYVLSPLGEDCDEYGYASLSELAEAKVFGGVPAIERDCHWSARPLAECEGVTP